MTLRLAAFFSSNAGGDTWASSDTPTNRATFTAAPPHQQSQRQRAGGCNTADFQARRPQCFSSRRRRRTRQQTHQQTRRLQQFSSPSPNKPAGCNSFEPQNEPKSVETRGFAENGSQKVRQIAGLSKETGQKVRQPAGLLIAPLAVPLVALIAAPPTAMLSRRVKGFAAKNRLSRPIFSRKPCTRRSNLAVDESPAACPLTPRQPSRRPPTRPQPHRRCSDPTAVGPIATAAAGGPAPPPRPAGPRA